MFMVIHLLQRLIIMLIDLIRLVLILDGIIRFMVINLKLVLPSKGNLLGNSLKQIIPFLTHLGPIIQKMTIFPS